MYLMAEDKVRIYYDDVGSGAPVMMIHGAATSSKVYDGLASRLVARFRCIRLDLRGLGQSDRASTSAVVLVLSVIAALLVSVGATLGGSLVYDYGFNVETAGDHPVWHKNEVDVFPGQK